MGDRLVVTCPSLRWTRGLGRRQFSLRDFFRTRVTFLPGNGLLASFARKEESFVDPALPFDFGKGSLSSNELGSFCFTSAVFALSLMSTQRSPEEPFEVEPFSRNPAYSPRCSTVVGAWSPRSSAVVGRLRRAEGSSPTRASWPQERGSSFSFFPLSQTFSLSEEHFVVVDDLANGELM